MRMLVTVQSPCHHQTLSLACVVSQSHDKRAAIMNVRGPDAVNQRSNLSFT